VRGVRGRLLVTIVGLVALTSIVLGVGAYLYVATSLREQQQGEAIAQTDFNVGVLADQLLPPDATRDDVAATNLLEAFELRGGVGTIVDFGDGDPVTSGFAAANAFARLSPELTTIVDRGEIGFERLTIGGTPYLVTGARRPDGGPAFYFLFAAAETEAAIAQLGQALLVGGLVLTGLAVLAAGFLARGILRPVREASQAAGRIAAGDLSARLPVDSSDEFGTWAATFNRMAASLDRTVGELQVAQDRQRAFVADVSHELRTPMTALVQEAGLLHDHLDAMPPDGRRAGELLVGDVARLRTLVDDLMEISRFDAAAEVAAPTEFDAAAFVRAVVANRLPAARLDVPAGEVRVVLDGRRLERILGNLLDNAREHGEGAAVEVMLAVDGDTLLLSVADRGPGVGSDELPDLFERFHKADPSRSRGGSGLGLAIAREHAELLGGTLRAELRPGGGMRFELRLPVTRPLPAGDEPVTAEAER
jgi:two-component system, OmpR family, sensor histidine kinase MtrB